MMRTLSGLLVALSATAIVAAAPPGDTLTQRLDAIAGAAVRENRAVGIVAAVVKGGDRLLLDAYGKADVTTDAAMTPDTVVPIGSVTKQFTAAAILQLRDQGKLSVDDPIEKWLPQFDTHGNRVTLRHLLNHTSGVAELTAMPELRTLQVFSNPNTTRDDLLALISRHAFVFPTGTMQIYSNSGFWLLGLVVEKASGMSYEDYIEQRIFAPLGMNRSMYCNDNEDVVRRARGHGMRGGAARRAPTMLYTANYSAGALCSTAADMVKWMQALHGGKVLTKRSYEEMMAPATLNDGTRLRYSMGLTIGEDSHGIRFIGHDGGGFGYSAVANWYPRARMAIVVLTNSEPDEIAKTTEDLAAAVLPAPRPPGPFKGDSAALTGIYKGLGPGGDATVEVTRVADGIAVSLRGGPAMPAPWVKDLTFRRNTTLVTFRRIGSGPATEVVFDTGGDHFTLKRQ
jgi:CubicO group peptidase (beta-lactamase class C family)